MPKVRLSRGSGSGTGRRRPPPEGWELIEPTLEELEAKMREAETDSHEGKRKVEALWPIFKIHHQRARYIFDLYYRRKAISKGKERSRSLLDPCSEWRLAIPISNCLRGSNFGSRSECGAVLPSSSLRARDKRYVSR
jgi:hypothetical protein